MESYLSHQNKTRGPPPRGAGHPPLEIRFATKGDVPAVVDLIVRTKRLNNEFDPLFAVVEGLRWMAEEYVSETVDSPGKLMLVATMGDKVVGVVRAEMRQRLFYEPSKEGFITDFYILPEFRRKALGNDMLRQASTKLKKMGAQLIVADVPSQNEIAVRFYTKRGFRSLNQSFGKRPQ
ncbi:MAG: GNAT family N-acetyltransferase [Thaumarchaeota archaeon]|nr:GNAT family N-acetyltransferase [Nitrososphaerota archaeon]